MRADAIRSMILILLAAGAVWLFITDKIKSAIFYPLIVAVVVFDLFSVDKRFLNSADFVTKTVASVLFEPTSADQQILQDKSLDYRCSIRQAPSWKPTGRPIFTGPSVAITRPDYGGIMS
ncbi:hypothetical protein [Spirosoma telluris]|uniref:hypothetical protein n=1 Tax=Spirosoma telluris TaxID=2183553 RepID=UPI002FC30052